MNIAISTSSVVPSTSSSPDLLAAFASASSSSSSLVHPAADAAAHTPATTAAATASASTTASDAAATTAIQDAMMIVPNKDKAEYLEALEKVPDLVHRESEAKRFLACERNDPWKAAKRLACYWKHRKDIFGPERAFLPLHQTGGDKVALNEQDLEILNTGVLVQVPNDKKHGGRSVLAADDARYLPEHSFPHYHPSRLRMTFYMLSVVSENEESQKTGIVVVGLITGAPNPELVKRFTALIKDAMPIRSVETHALFLPSRVMYRSFIDKIIEHIFVICASFATSIYIHRGNTDAEVVKKLKSLHDLSKTGIPEWMGGSWKLEDFDKWKRLRIRIEQERLKTTDEKLQRKRKVNAVLSRQKRARQKSQFVQLQEECSALRVSNEQLAAENQQLEQYLAYARSEAEILEYLQQQQQHQQSSSAAEVISSSSSSTTTMRHSGDDVAAAAAVANCYTGGGGQMMMIMNNNNDQQQQQQQQPTISTHDATVAGDYSSSGNSNMPMPPDAASLCNFFVNESL